MSKERFERLRQSIIEAGQAMRGEIEPSREFAYEVEVTKLRKDAATDWAICVTDEDDELIPLKLYKIRFSKTGYVSVTDEEGERVVCPAHWFVPVRLAPEVRQIVADLAA
ncbi:MAG: hypothetical protein MOB07_29630 [Acidobacteria bacterium]|nr:hypothetical protein [Acidobacteriota bacterium]